MNAILSQKTYSFISGIIFAVVALVHLWRIAAGWEVIAYGTVIPMWVSWTGMIVAGILAFCGLSFGLRRDAIIYGSQKFGPTS